MVHLGQHLCSQPPSIWPGRSGLLPGDPRFDDQNDVADSKLHRLHGQREAGGVRGLRQRRGRQALQKREQGDSPYRRDSGGRAGNLGGGRFQDFGRTTARLQPEQGEDNGALS